MTRNPTDIVRRILELERRQLHDELRLRQLRLRLVQAKARGMTVRVRVR